MPQPLLPVSHTTQTQQADCLAACASMVLAYWQKPQRYPSLLRRLQVGEFGTASSNIVNLNRLRGIAVDYREGTLSDLFSEVDAGFPCITFVRTNELSYWSGVDVRHAVVVVGYNDSTIFLNDPAFNIAPQKASHGDFELAWLEQGYDFAVIRPN